MTVRKTLGCTSRIFASDGDDASADIEPADFVDGLQQAGTGRVRPRQFESGGREAARQISLQRNEAG